MVVRLRPVVHATPTADGLHLRGWSSSFTVAGGAGLWKVWQRLAPSLAEGVAPDDLGVAEGTPPAVRAAVELILAQLREHDMLVSVPREWAAPPEIAAWLESVAADPADAWERLRAASFVVAGGPSLVAAAVRALEAAGLSARTVVGRGGDVVITAGELAVHAGCGSETGYVLPPGTSAAEVPGRLGVAGAPAEVLAALVASAAVHRLVCAVGGLPDPSTEFVVHPGESARVDHYPQVLVAKLEPLQAKYHPLLTGEPPTDPWRALDALTDPELGPVETPRFGDLPQVPANLATSGDALGIGTTADSARLNAAINALKTGGVAGIDESHARGAALRLAARTLPGEPVPDREWTGDPTARRWWKALTLRCAVAASVEVVRVRPDVVRAEIRAAHHVLAWAVEATAADAVAFAALAATGYAQAGREGTGHLNGAAPVLTDDVQPEWAGREWLWPADVRDREARLRAALADVELVAVELDPELSAAGLVAYAERAQ